MAPRNLQWIRDRVSQKINFNIDQTDQDFRGPTNDTNRVIDYAINEAYAYEVNEARNETHPDSFKETGSITWLSGNQTLTLPVEYRDKQIERIEDTTSTTPGVPLWVLPRDGGYSPTISIQDRNTLIWNSSSGPGQDTTLTIIYLAEASEMNAPTDEPYLIPSRFRHLLVWSAAIILREEADETAPQMWYAQQQQWRLSFWADYFKGKITEPARPSVVQTHGDESEFGNLY